MRKQLTHISVHQTSKVCALMYFGFLLLFVPIGIAMIVLMPQQQQRWMGIFFVAAPIVYGVVGYLAVALSAVLYNFLAARVGGVEFDTTEKPGAV